MTPEDSFYELKNAFIQKGVIKKRFGSTYIGAAASSLLGQLNSRLRINVGTTDGSGDLAGTVPGAIFKPGQMFSIGDEIFTVPEDGTPVDMLTNGASTVHTYHVSGANAGDFDIQGSELNTTCFFYPAEPVMGLTMYEAGPIQNHPALAFDTQFAYKFTGTAWSRVGAQVYTGTNLNYFYSCNFEGTTRDETALFVTNFKADAGTSDLMYYSLDASTFTAFTPTVVPAGGGINLVELLTAKILIPFKGRLVALNVYERTTAGGPVYTYKAYPNRIRFSSINNPLAATAWISGSMTGYIGGGYLDAPTEEEIVSAQYVRDRLIVYFERSTYELVSTGVYADPFVWQKINSDLGSTSTFATIPFDGGSFSIGSTGIHVCNGISVTRIDKQIPNEIFTYLKSSSATQRICGIKEYYDELAYWSIPNQFANDVDAFPDTILVFNYENNSWAKFDDCITAFGYFEQTIAETWENDYQRWEDDDSLWSDNVTIANNRQVIAGNQQGFTFSLSTKYNTNAPVLQVSKVDGSTLTVVDHNLAVGDFVQFYNCSAAGDNGIFRVSSVTDGNTIVVDGFAAVGYTGAGTISRVSRIDIRSTAWNPYNTKGYNLNLNKMIFAVKKAQYGQITVNFYASQSNVDIVAESIANLSALGTNILEMNAYDLVPLEDTQSVLWHAIYFQANGNNIQIQLTWSDEQIVDSNVVGSDFEIQAIILETSKSESMG